MREMALLRYMYRKSMRVPIRTNFFARRTLLLLDSFSNLHCLQTSGLATTRRDTRRPLRITCRVNSCSSIWKVAQKWTAPRRTPKSLTGLASARSDTAPLAKKHAFQESKDACPKLGQHRSRKRGRCPFGIAEVRYCDSAALSVREVSSG